MHLHTVHLSHSSLNVSSSPVVLTAGSTVNGRVIAQTGTRSYLISLAGQKIEVTSETALTPGSVFSATVKTNGSQLTLALISEHTQSPALQKFSLQNTALSAPLSAFLSELGFEPTTDSFHIVQFMQQLGMKINVPEAKKALITAQKSASDKKERAELSLLFQEKGLPDDDTSVQAVLGKSHEDSEQKRHKQETPHDEQQSRARNARTITSETIRSFFSHADEAARTHTEGRLSLFNSVRTTSRTDAPLRHWIVLPFEWDFNDYYGTLRLLFDSDLKKLEKLIIDLKNNEKKNIFVLGFAENRLTSVRFARDEANAAFSKEQLAALLTEQFHHMVAVECIDAEHLRGFCADDETLATVRGEA